MLLVALRLFLFWTVGQSLQWQQLENVGVGQSGNGSYDPWLIRHSSWSVKSLRVRVSRPVLKPSASS